jgi:hypothetical protein
VLEATGDGGKRFKLQRDQPSIAPFLDGCSHSLECV